MSTAQQRLLRQQREIREESRSLSTAPDVSETFVQSSGWVEQQDADIIYLLQQHMDLRQA